MPNMQLSTLTIDSNAVRNFYNKIFVDDAVLHAVSTSVGRSSGTDGHQQRQQRCYSAARGGSGRAGTRPEGVHAVVA